MAEEPQSAAVERFKKLSEFNRGNPLSLRDFQYELKYTEASGLGFEKGVCRHDPSSVVKIDDLYYVWYTHFEDMRPPLGFERADATSRAVTWDLCNIWYATSPDGVNSTEQGEAVPLGPKGEFDDRSVFTADILVAEDKYYLFYQAVSCPYTQRTQNVIGMSWAKSPGGPWQRHPEPVLTTGEPGQWVDPSQVPADERKNFGWPITKKSAWDGHIRHNGTFVKTKGFCTDVFFAEAMRWIRSQQANEQPFFVYLSLNAPQGPFNAPEEYTAIYDADKDPGFFGMISNIDDNMGTLMNKLKEWGLENNTLLTQTVSG